MTALQAILRRAFLPFEWAFDWAFSPAWNPLYHLGALGFFYFWVVCVSGVYVYFFFDTGITEAYDSVEWLTHEQWYLGGVMRSLHRYASDGMVLMMALHMVREFSLGRYRGPRWFTWFTGGPIIWLVLICGITGYWLVWDEMAQYVAVSSAEWLDWLPVFGGAIVRNFLDPTSLDDRFFSLLAFLHVAVPLVLLLVLWVHLQRVSRPKVFPARGLAIGTMAMLLVLSLVQPAVSHPPADLSRVPGDLDLDWYYLFAYPLVDIWSEGPVWALSFVATLLLMALPWLPPPRKPVAARVDLANCNGCTRCVDDCPYAAVSMEVRTDGRPFEREAVVQDSLCVACGLCAGACPTSTPFRRAGALVPGIDLPDQPLAALRDQFDAASETLSGKDRVIMVGCQHGVRTAALAAVNVAVVTLPCVAALPPSFIDYLLSRKLADGVMLTGCAEENCFNRDGIRLTRERIAGERDPRLRKRVPRERLRQCWAGIGGEKELAAELRAFQAELAQLPAPLPPNATARPEAAEVEG